MKPSLASMLPSLIAASTLAALSGTVLPPLLVGLAILLSYVVRQRLAIDYATQRLAAVVIVALTIAGIRATGRWPDAAPMHAFGFGFALVPLIIIAFRQFVASPEGGRTLDRAFGFVTILACASAKGGRVYVGSVALVLVASWAARRAEDPLAVRWQDLSARSKLIGVAALGACAVVGLSTLAALRPLSGFLARRFERAVEARFESRMGLPQSGNLGSMGPLLRSNTVVLRISGPHIERVRGVVLDDYEGGRWAHSSSPVKQKYSVLTQRPPGDGVVEIRHVRAEESRLFFPLDARDIALSTGMLQADPLGTAKVDDGDRDDTRTLWFREGARNAFPISLPTPDDTHVAEPLAAPLKTLADEWTRGAAGQEDALRLIESHFAREFTYSLDHREHGGIDPVLSFLTVSREGYCEYFASAMVLLARSLGIPARLVFGYRVGERNPVFSHYVVRQKNAHAWVEAYLPEHGWTTFDPTPMSELPQNAEHDELGSDAWLETAAMAWSNIEGWLAQRSVFELAFAGVLGVVVFGLQRWLRERKGRGRVRPDALPFDPPTREFLLLERALSRAGRARRPGESIERWATRVADPKVSSALLVYAEARYGGTPTRELAELLIQAAARSR